MGKCVRACLRVLVEKLFDEKVTVEESMHNVTRMSFTATLVRSGEM